MINIKQRRHIHEKHGNLGRECLGWHRGCQEVENHSEGLERGGGLAGQGHKDDISTKSGDFGRGAGVAQGVPRGGKSLGGAGGRGESP